MNNVMDRQEVLKLNCNRVAIDTETPAKIFGDLFNYQVDRRQQYILDNGGNKIRKMLAFDVVFAQLSDGSYNFDDVVDIQLLDGDDWLQLTPRSYDLLARTPKLSIRIPRVVMVLEYDGITEVKYGKSYNDVYDLHDGVCAYTKRRLKKSEGSKDHVIPRSRGGKDDISNIVLCDKEINNKKGNRYNHEVGLPDVVPIIPKTTPRHVQLRRLNRIRQIPEWRYFLGD